LEKVIAKSGISGSTLKLIAIFTMLIDHIAATVILQMINNGIGGQTLIDIYWVMRSIGRMAFPVFCFLLQGQVADRYFILADFRSYANAQQKINDYYKNKSAWRKSALLNIAHVGKFSSDRTIQEYVDDIWHLDRITVNMAGV
jgi:hypothetical protein